MDQFPQRRRHWFEDGQETVQVLGQFSARLDAGTGAQQPQRGVTGAGRATADGSPVSKARVGWMPSRRVTAAAVSVASPDSRKVVLVCTLVSVRGDGRQAPAIS